MSRPKFTLNAFLLVLLIFSAIGFFFTVVMTDIADRTAVNGFFPIKGTKYSVMYSSLEPDGLYTGSENAHTLVMEGTFGNDWGAFLNGDELYLNEYDFTDLGFIRSNVVKINIETLKKETVFKDALLRGQCLSGEAVCSVDFSLPSNFPATNSLLAFSGLSAGEKAFGGGADVVFLDPKTGEVVFAVENAIEKKFDELYLERTLEEIKR